MDKSKNQPLVSVIMPIFNAEKYLNTSLQSVTCQTYKNLEIICINDESTDNSINILETWIKKDKRIKLISQKNRGAGAARNRGMEEAKGQYTLFFDADDVLSKNMIRTLVNTATFNDTDIIIYGYYKFSSWKKIYTNYSVKSFGIPLNKVIAPEDISQCLFQVDHGMPWNKFYKTDFIKKTNVKFQELKNTNDEFFSRLTTVQAKRMLILENKLIGYRVENSNSLQKNVKDYVLDCTCALRQIHDELKNKGYYEKYYKTYQRLAGYIIILKLLAVVDSEAFDILAAEICNNTIEQCEIKEEYLDDYYKKAFRFLKESNISKAKEELLDIKENEKHMSIKQKIKRILYLFLG